MKLTLKYLTKNNNNNNNNYYYITGMRSSINKYF